MARIKGVDIPNDKHTVIALTYIYGIGRSLAKEICAKAGVEPMLTIGRRDICILDDDWTIETVDNSPAAHYEHTIVVTKDGYEILTGGING